MEENLEGYKNIDSKFRLAILAAKRAKQLIRGSKKLVDIEAGNPLTIALEEIKQGFITPKNLYTYEQDKLFMDVEDNTGEESGMEGEEKKNKDDLETETSVEEN